LSAFALFAFRNLRRQPHIFTYFKRFA